MLLDFPKIKEKLQKIYTLRMKSHSPFYSGPLSESPKIMIFEGDKYVIVREDGSVEESEFEEMKAKIEIDPDLENIEEITPEQILKKLDDAANELAIQQSKLFYNRIDEATRKAGTSFSADGKPFCIEHFFEMLDKISIDFDENGKPIMPSINIGKDMEESVRNVISESGKDPQNKKRFDDIIERKKEEWRVRKSNRKLVG